MPRVSLSSAFRCSRSGISSLGEVGVRVSSLSPPCWLCCFGLLEVALLVGGCHERVEVDIVLDRDATVCSPIRELCNGRDDDCDDFVDDGFDCVAGSQSACVTSLGDPGVRTCSTDCGWSPCAATCDDFLVRSPSAHAVELSSAYLCGASCAVLVGDPPLSWSTGSVAQASGGRYLFSGLPSGNFRLSFAMPSGGCAMSAGNVAPGTSCPTGPWANYGQIGGQLCQSARRWVWCGNDGQNYTCSLRLSVTAEGLLLPDGNCNQIPCW